MSTTDSRVFGLDLLLALAISLVLASHLVGGLEPLGILGVELFFVLSGFLVGGIFLRLRVGQPTFTLATLTRFWKRRWYRTLPNYFLFLLLFTIISLVTGRFPGWAKLMLYPLFLQNWLWPSDSFFLLSWSLAVEEWFYLLIPLTVILVASIVKSRTTSFAIGCIVMGLLSCSIRVLFFADPPWDGVARKVSLGRMDALAWGCLVAYGQHNKATWYRQLSPSRSLTIVSTLAMVICASVFHAFPEGLGLISPVWLLAVVPLSLSLLLPAFASWRDYVVPFSKTVVNTSKWSYSLYLVHMPIFL